jgi:hypothetical protein
MPRYKHYDYNQTSMVVINFEEPCLPLALKGEPGTFEYAQHHLITDRLDLTPFDELYRNDGKAGGRPAYDPRDSPENHSVFLFQRHHLQPRDSVVLRAQYYF